MNRFAPVILIALCSPASAGDGLVPIPGATPIPGYGIGYSFGSPPLPQDVVGPYGSSFAPPPPPPQFDEGPYATPSRLSIYAADGPNGEPCSWHRIGTPGFGSRWEKVC